MSFRDQVAAQRLAMCNDIGEASYVDSLVAAALLRALLRLPQADTLAARLEDRYKVPLQGELQQFISKRMSVLVIQVGLLLVKLHGHECNTNGHPTYSCANADCVLLVH